MADHTLITIAEFEKVQDRQLCQEAANMLCKEYKGYPWFIRNLGDRIFGIGLTFLMHMGGGVQLYVIHPRDWLTPDQFKKLVVFGGGELLERCNLSRAGWNGIEPTDLPEGFDIRFDKRHRITKIKLN